jgi:hypothetical protein
LDQIEDNERIGMNWLPDINYWAVICGFLVALNIWQYAKYHGTTGKLSAELAHVLAFGHAPEGKAIVPAASVTVAPPTTTDRFLAGTSPKEKGYL